MTDVIVQHLLNNEVVRIKCRDWVKKIAVYKHRLAVSPIDNSLVPSPPRVRRIRVNFHDPHLQVLLPTRVIIYELVTKEANKMHYQIKEKLNKSFDCNLLVVCSEHLVFCQVSRTGSQDNRTYAVQIEFFNTSFVFRRLGCSVTLLTERMWVNGPWTT